MKKRYSICNEGISNDKIYVYILLVLVIGLSICIYILYCNTTQKPLHVIPISSVDVPSIQRDVLLNPYDAPLRDDRYNVNLSKQHIIPVHSIPINVATQSINTSYRQVGILTRGNTILPLMGKPLYTNRDKWNFYTMNDKNNMIKLPLSNKGKSCTNEYGCDNIYNGDGVYVEGYNDTFKATVYDNQVMQYIPFI